MMKNVCQACRAVGMIHCSDPLHCGMVWDEVPTDNEGQPLNPEQQPSDKEPA